KGRCGAGGKRTHHPPARREGQTAGDRPRTGRNVVGRVRRLHQGGCRQVEEGDRRREDPADRRMTEAAGSMAAAAEWATPSRLRHSTPNNATPLSYPARRGAGSTFHFRASRSACTRAASAKGLGSTTKPCCTASRPLSL